MQNMHTYVNFETLSLQMMFRGPWDYHQCFSPGFNNDLLSKQLTYFVKNIIAKVDNWNYQFMQWIKHLRSPPFLKICKTASDSMGFGDVFCHWTPLGEGHSWCQTSANPVVNRPRCVSGNWRLFLIHRFHTSNFGGITALSPGYRDRHSRVHILFLEDVLEITRLVQYLLEWVLKLRSQIFRKEKH